MNPRNHGGILRRRAANAAGLVLLLAAGAARAGAAGPPSVADIVARTEAGTPEPGLALAGLEAEAPPTPTGAPPVVDKLKSYALDRQVYYCVDRRGRKTRRRRCRRSERRVVEIVSDPTGREPGQGRKAEYIVLHSALGGDGAGGCDGPVNYLLRHTVAAHFMVCRDGEIVRMVPVTDNARHVKNGAINESSIGIETETGYGSAPYFKASDWDPRGRWRLYASLSWLIRDIARQTGIPLDRQHVITHRAADAGIPGGHTDPGPYFDNDFQAPVFQDRRNRQYRAFRGMRGYVYPEFQSRFHQDATPYDYLMMLLADHTPPAISVAEDVDGLARILVSDQGRPADLGLYEVGVFRVVPDPEHPGEEIYDEKAVIEWSPADGALPPSQARIEHHFPPGDYAVVARDMAGNVQVSRYTAPAGPPVAGR